MLFDTHCHLDHPALQPRLQELLDRAEAAGVSRFLIPGVTPGGWDTCRELAGRIPRLRAAFGVHPMHADLVDGPTLSRLQELSGSATAIGEIGLDYQLGVPRDLQQKAFRAQLRIACAHQLPILIHCRKAFADLLSILKEEGVPVAGGVMHAYSGSVETARDCLALGLHISLAGTVTYPNAVRPLEVARFLPLERLLLESDAPDLTPEPHRGTPNLPEYLIHTANRVAQLKGISLPELARRTTENAARLFNL